MRDRAVLVFTLRDEEVLLIRKLRGLGAGLINAPGGRLEAGESYSDAGVREVLEETGTTVTDLEEVATLDFRFTNGYELDVRAFRARWSHGTLRACDEADPFWCRLDAIPWHQMWADDPLWWPPALQGLYVNGSFLFQDALMLRADWRVHDRSTAANLG